MSHDFPTDPLERLLGNDVAVPPEELRRRLLDRTTRLLRRRLWARRAAWAASVAAAFCGGALLIWLWQSPEPQKQDKLPPPKGPQAQQTPSPEELPMPQADSALALEWRAFDSLENRAAEFFRAGHRYFEEEKDMESALRCYRQALDACSPEELRISPHDNWLIMALKDSRRKEKINVQDSH